MATTGIYSRPLLSADMLPLLTFTSTHVISSPYNLRHYLSTLSAFLTTFPLIFGQHTPLGQNSIAEKNFLRRPRGDFAWSTSYTIYLTTSYLLQKARDPHSASVILLSSLSLSATKKSTFAMVTAHRRFQR